jgi:hypothetical protein
MMKEFTGFRLIPSLDGSLYQFSWDSIEVNNIEIHNM